MGEKISAYRKLRKQTDAVSKKRAEKL